MEIPHKALEAGTGAIVLDGRGGREAREDARKVLEAAAPFIAARAVWNATRQIDTHRFGPYAAPYLSAVKSQLDDIANEIAPQ